MKKRICMFISVFFLLVTIGYCTMTPIGALRIGMLFHGYPLHAFTLEFMDQSHHMSLNSNQIGYSLENPPFEEETQAELINWIVTRHGIFYTAEYYGWG